MKLQKDVEKAQKNKSNIVAIALIINSPGGSPVYSSMMGQKLLSFAKTK
jgi:ClpP class serine protease